MKPLLGLGLGVLLASMCQAAGFYCQSANRVVVIGDTTANVRAACGEPSQIHVRQQPVNKPVMLTHWTYLLGKISVDNQALGYAASLTLTFKEDKLANIERSALVGKLDPFPCTATGGITLGSPLTRVLALCGQPDYINTEQSHTAEVKEQVVWTYSQGDYLAPVQLIFENDALAAIQAGNKS